MTPQEYSAIVVAERREMSRLQRRLRAFGSLRGKSDDLAAIVDAYAAWHVLALKLVVMEKRMEAENADQT